jgi:16S rRNA (cytosine967-C5)-methyltransferase
LESAGCSILPSPFVAECLIVKPGVPGDDPEGRWSVQSESSAMAVDLLDPQPGERVADLCCGRGNKSMQIAARLGPQASFAAVDQDARKLRAWRETARRLGVEAEPVEADVLAFEPGSLFDAVLLDAPCSALGTIGRHAEARWRKSPGDGARLAASQAALLRRAAALTAPGGRLVYAVCSFDPAEGAGVIDEFLAGAPDFHRAASPARYAEFERGGDVVVPPGIEGRDGFYISRLERRA